MKVFFYLLIKLVCNTPRSVEINNDVFINPQNYINNNVNDTNNKIMQNKPINKPNNKPINNNELSPIKFKKYIRSKHDIEMDKDDKGICLTMHQPWASLLVYGIKRTEGRIWNTDYRGRLWIHAAAKEVDPEEIDLIENTYSELYANEGVNNVEFPPLYPTSALLGCVEVIDVLSQEDLQKDECKYPQELKDEADSPYNFICVNPQVYIF